MIRIRTIFTGVAGSPWYSNLFFEGAATSVDAEAMRVAVGDFWDTIAGAISNRVQWTIEAFVPVIQDDGTVTGGFTGTTPQGGIGTNSTNLLPQATQMQINLNTGVYNAGRQLRGKLYIPGQCEDTNSDAGTPAATTTNGVISAMNTLLNAPSDLVVWSRKNSNHSPVQSVDAATKWAVLRSRRD